MLQVARAEWLTHGKTFRFRPSGGKEHRRLCDLLMKHRKGSRGFSPLPFSTNPLQLCLFSSVSWVKMFTPTCLEEIWKRLLGRKRNTRGPVPSPSSSHPWLLWLKQNQSLLFALAGAITRKRFSSSCRVCFGSCKLEKQTHERKERNVWNFESGLSSECTHCLRGEASPFFFGKVSC